MTPSAPLRALVIDDDRRMRDLHSEFLTRLGYRADAAANGGQGLVLLGLAEYDVVLTDIEMPGLSGWEVMTVVRKMYPSVGVIVISGSLPPGRHRPEADWPYDDRVVLLSKPIDIDDLKAAIDRVAHAVPEDAG